MTDRPTTEPASAPGLRRALTFWPLLLYGLSVIIGAGIYVAIGAVIGRAGGAAPLSFLLAGVTAGMTGLCYAELANRFPDASGAVSYVRHGFGSDRLAQATGAAMTLAVAVSAAAIARGATHYLTALIPLSPTFIIAVLVTGFTALAMVGVRESVGVAAAMGAIEIAGLIVATSAGLLTAPAIHAAGLLPAGAAGYQGMLAGAFIAFFAFTGFETLANLAEEVQDAPRTVPRAIIGAIVGSTLLYVAVASAVVVAGTPAGNPLMTLFDGTGARVFALAAGIAVANGVLVQIIMLARLFYGMARNGQLPGILMPEMLGSVHPRTRTPIHATALAGFVILMTALAVPFEQLLVVTSTVTLGLFTLVDLALWRVHRTAPAVAPDAMTPRWVPPVGAILSLLLLLAELL